MINDIQIAGAVRIGEGWPRRRSSTAWRRDPRSRCRHCLSGSGRNAAARRNLVNLNSFPGDVDADIFDAGACVGASGG